MAILLNLVHFNHRFGRKPSIVISFTIAAVAGLLTAFADDFWTFGFLRFLVGLTLLAFSEDPYVLSIEYIGTKHRTLSIICWVMGYIVASALCPWIAYYLKNWRLLCVVTSAPLLIFVFGAKYIPESASWMMSQGRLVESRELLKRVAKVNGKRLPSTDVLSEPQADTYLLAERSPTITADSNSIEKSKLDPEPEPETAPEPEHDLDLEPEPMVNSELRFYHILATPRLRSRTILLSTIWFVSLCCYHTNIYSTSNLGTDLYTSFTYGALVEFPSIICVFIGMDRIGRRALMVLSTGLAGMTGLSTLLMAYFDVSNYLAINLIMRVCLATQYNVLIQYSAEVYPTGLRGRAIAFLRTCGTIGLLLSPSVAYLALNQPHLPFSITGSMLLVISFLSLYLPETCGQSLPQTFEEGEQFGKDQRIFSFKIVK